MGQTIATAASYTGSTNFKITNVNNAYADTSSATYASLSATLVYGKSVVYFGGFDFSSIPEGATIDNVTIRVKIRLNKTNYSQLAQVQAYKNGVADGSPISYSSTTVKTYTLTTGQWTRADLDTLSVCVEIKRNQNKSTPVAYLYGIDVTVDWTEPHETLYVKKNGVWVEVDGIYKKTRKTATSGTLVWTAIDVETFKNELETSGVKLIRRE